MNWRMRPAKIRCSSAWICSTPNSPAAPAPAGGAAAALRRGLNAERMKGVLQLVAEKSGWGKTHAAERHRHGRGFPLQPSGILRRSGRSHGRCRQESEGQKVWVAADVGSQIINPSAAENIVQGGMIDGLSEVMSQKITVEKGRVVQTNFHQHGMVRLAQAPPEIEVHFLTSNNTPTGLGRTGAAADPARGGQCHLRGVGRAGPFAAAGGVRL